VLAEAAIVKVSNPLPIINLVLDGLTSENSKRAYGKALNDFITWYQREPTTGLTKATVQQYRTLLQNSGVAPSTVNLRLSAIRKLAQEAADNGLVDQSMASSISRVKGVKSQGVRAGNWLTKEQAQDLLDIPDCKTIKGLRDRAILAVFLGAGLRRSEVSSLSFDHIQQREGRWVFVDLIGKGNRIRTIPIPSWVKSAIDEWVNAAGISAPGLIFRPIHKAIFPALGICAISSRSETDICQTCPQGRFWIRSNPIIAWSCKHKNNGALSGYNTGLDGCAL